MLFDAGHQTLKLRVQSYTLGTKDQFVEVLPVLRLDNQSRVNILVNERVVEYEHVWELPIPYTVLENGGRGPAVAFDNDVRRMLSGKSTPLENGN